MLTMENILLLPNYKTHSLYMKSFYKSLSKFSLALMTFSQQYLYLLNIYLKNKFVLSLSLLLYH